MLLTILLVLNTILLTALLVRELTRRKDADSVERLVREEMAANRRESAQSIHAFTDQLLKLTDMNERKLEKVREVVETRLQALQEDNSRKLEKMRETVDEKLHSTLEKRLGESFKVVSERLEKVHAGLGEMQSLASGVGDLKKVLTNVKTRGTWGEIQLGNLLEQMLTVDQYERNVVTKQGSRDPVEFAIKLPGRDGKVVYIPVDAKFPKEDYDRLLEAQDKNDMAALEESVKAIESRIKLEARKIRDKYIDPPHTTDFAIMYLITEGLYAEVLRRPGLCEFLQREFRVMVAGPTTIAAVLNSLQVGFRTLAVEKRASEIRQLLVAVKNEFGKFGDMLENTKKKLDSASKEIESAATKSRTIERKLSKVQELPSSVKPDLIVDESFGVPAETFDEDTIAQ
ncbi:MAG TPA: DNA recombination protein RmuC [Candidatus Omnitrophica bacterium]|nr:MAG: recombinase RmuC [Omnitrophica WOR_2 bacterium GWA2_53_43]HBO97306.1 DNA recombination protein RmuC [Candidatus Omnitrophota bacterium]HCI44888.1 DNA recombination protein RmuC [Candidatus Omnitrophota bacterium]